MAKELSPKKQSSARSARSKIDWRRFASWPNRGRTSLTCVKYPRRGSLRLSARSARRSPPLSATTHAPTARRSTLAGRPPSCARLASLRRRRSAHRASDRRASRRRVRPRRRRRPTPPRAVMRASLTAADVSPDHLWTARATYGLHPPTGGQRDPDCRPLRGLGVGTPPPPDARDRVTEQHPVKGASRHCVMRQAAPLTGCCSVKSGIYQGDGERVVMTSV